AVGQEVHVDALRGDLKEVVPSLTQQTVSLLPRRPADRLNHFDLKRLRGKLHGSRSSRQSRQLRLERLAPFIFEHVSGHVEERGRVQLPNQVRLPGNLEPA